MAGARDLALAAWLAFSQRLAVSELVAGALAACVAGTASLIVWSHNRATFRGAARSLAQVWRLPKYAFTGTYEILAVLARHLAGRSAPSLLACVPYDTCGDDPRSRARRALAIAFTTITPNFLVLGVDKGRGLMWYHQIRRSPLPRMTVNLGARA